MGTAAEALRSSHCRIILTGAGGWIGKATLELLHETLGPAAFSQRVVAFGSAARTIRISGALSIDQLPLSELGSLPSEPSLILHLAYLTKDRVSGMAEAEYREANSRLRRTVLDALDVIDARAIFVASSGAAARADDPAASFAMRLYGSLKKADEDAFAEWAKRRHRRAVICRIFALSGPHMNKHDTYALASFINDALAGEPIRIRADFPVYRSYVAIRELMSLVLGLMLESSAGVARFDTGGEPVEMQRIAEVVAGTLGPVPVQRPLLKRDNVDEYVGNDVAYRQLLSRFAIEHLPLSQQVVETAAFFASDRDRLAVAENRLECAAGGGAPEPADKRKIP
jgi:nucleoside-diphosphate-sugar epimerase